ncbi:carboxylesterase family protein [Amycolatopsis anabasis]|uniref:carboxylesterase family protein n=1 Tax=Amycolatopsis anabasis TaxID=1840409 RepID=UPI00131DABF3|nr:carboxylesterase family protein [Amycolatopsis anabasis]
MTVVETTAGRVRGYRLEDAIAFRGVPYGEHTRFAPATPPRGWTGIREAAEPGPIAPQPPSRLEHVMGPIRLPQAEDCLTLNLYTTGVQGARPVLVWVHGGGFSSGSGGLDWYAGHRLAARGDLVVVSINYRLGALGFLSAPGIGTGNLGLRDQVLALEWVRDNISRFGGDPNRVTLAGQSAGALSTLALLSAPAARGLFHRVALQSTPTGMAPLSPGEAAGHADRLRYAAGIQHVRELYDLPVARLIDAQVEVARQATSGIAPPFQLVADGDLVHADLVRAALDGPRTDALLSWTRDEGAAFAPEPEVARLVTDTVFAQGTAELAAGLPGDAHAYRFDWHPEDSPLGACHCLDIPFVFGTFDAFTEAPMLTGARDFEPLAEAVRQTWTAFAHGEPDPVHPLLRKYSN